MPDTVLQRLREASSAAFDGQPVVFAYLFGSYANGTATSRSDIDIAVYCRDSNDTLRLRLDLAGALERAPGLSDIEVIVLNEAPALSLTGRVQENHRVIYSADEVCRVRYESLTSRQYHDFKIHEQRIAREGLARLAARR